VVTGVYAAGDASGHFLVGNPAEYPPSRIRTAVAGAPLRTLARRVRAVGRRVDTVAKARAHGYVQYTFPTCPGFEHWRVPGTRVSRASLDPRHPQALVFWCNGHSRRLAAFMFRAPGDLRPPTFTGLLQWHKHWPGDSGMTHAWLVRDPRAAFANCAPFRALRRDRHIAYRPFVATRTAICRARTPSRPRRYPRERQSPHPGRPSPIPRARRAKAPSRFDAYAAAASCRVDLAALLSGQTSSNGRAT
jgi:hypothetical protein